MTKPTGPDIHARGAAVFGSGPDGVYWPYDVSGIDRSLRRTDPERFQRQLDELNHKRLAIVDWAERHGFKSSSVQCCPWWLTRRTSRRCGPGKCTQFGTGSDPDREWLDHTICWLMDGKPVAITSAPYHLGPESAGRLDWWTRQDPRLSVAHGPGWYGFGTTQVVIWRSDLVATVEPAG